MESDPFDDHPDLGDVTWQRAATRAAMKDVRRRRGRARRGRRWVSLVLLVAIAGTGYLGYRQGLFDQLLTEAPAQAASTSDTRGAPTTTMTTMVTNVRVDLNQPFVGTPAASWPDGAAGITMPDAQPVGRHTAAQVAAAYAQVRQVVATSRLDRKVIETHDRAPFLDLIAPNSRPQLTRDFADPAQSSGWVTTIADGYRLLPVAPKVSGRMWAEPGAKGEIAVHTDFVFAYAFQTDHPDRLHDALEIVAIDRAQATYLILDQAWPVADRGVWPSEYDGFMYSMACEPAKKGQLAPYVAEPRTSGPPPSRTPNEYFDPTLPLPTDDGCRA